MRLRLSQPKNGDWAWAELGKKKNVFPYLDRNQSIVIRSDIFSYRIENSDALLNLICTFQLNYTILYTNYADIRKNGAKNCIRQPQNRYQDQD